MAELDRLRGLRAALGNALVWGTGWAAMWVLSVAGLALLGLAGIGEGISLGNAVGASVRFGAAFGIIGFAAGGVFAGFTRFSYHGRPLKEISWVRFGLAGGVVGGLFVPVFLQTMNLISGDGLVSMRLLETDALLGALFGAAAAGLSLKLAQLGEDRMGDGSGGSVHLADSRTDYPLAMDGRMVETTSAGRTRPPGQRLRES